MNKSTTYTEDMHIRISIKKIEQSIDELEKAKAVLLSMLPKKKVNISELQIELPGGGMMDYKGKEIKDGC